MTARRRDRGGGRLSKRKGYVINTWLFTWYLELAPLPANPRLCLFACFSVVVLFCFLFLFCFFFFSFCFCLFVCFDVASFFVFLVLTEYLVCSVLIEHLQRFQPEVGCLQRDSAL